jgi:ferredoxin-thioredoxin reductase catalytic chain
MNEPQNTNGAPSERALRWIRDFVEKYREKSGTSLHPNPEVAEAVELGLAVHLDELGRPRCPCNFYPDKAAELAASRRWVCACDEMMRYKYCHCFALRESRRFPHHRIPS